MRHGKKGRKLNRTSAHRKALLRNLATSLVEHDKILTTLAKAKSLRPFIEPLVTLSRIDTLHNRRLVAKKLYGTAPVRRLFEVIGPANRDRPGGYTRIIRAGFRYGDDAPMAVIEFVSRQVGSAEKEHDIFIPDAPDDFG